MNLANKITVTRFLLIFVFVILASFPSTFTADMLHWKIAFIIAIFAGLTDILDGYIARKQNTVTTFGKLMDPLTDKIFTVSSFVILVGYNIVPSWIAILILAREFAVTGLRSLATDKGDVLAASWLGKLKTGLQMFVLLFGGAIWVGWMTIPALYWNMLLYAVAALTVYTGIHYYVKARHLYFKGI